MERFASVSDRDIQDFTSSSDRFNVICIANPVRCGVLRFLTMLEYTFYPPGTSANDDFVVYVMKWEEGTAWCVVSIPMEHKHRAYQIAIRADMRIADGVPVYCKVEKLSVVTSIRPSKMGELKSSLPDMNFIIFPVQGDNSFTLENASDDSVYKNDETLRIRLLQEECDNIVKGYVASQNTSKTIH
jgi:hypothetical protein